MLSRFLPLLAVALVSVVSAQPAQIAYPAPDDVLTAFHLRAGSVQNLALPLANAVPFSARVRFAGGDHTLTLRPHDVRAADFKLLIDDGTALRQVATPVSVTYRGEVLGLPRSDVAASLVDGQLSATIHLDDGSLWAVQPLSTVNSALPRESHVVYRTSDVIQENVHCGVDNNATGVKVPPGIVGPAALKIAEIGIDADRAYYTRYGSNPVTVQNQVTSVMNSVGVIYRRDVEIDYSITAILVRTTVIYSWNGDLCNLLGQFGNYWAANHGAIRRDVAHLFTGEGSFSGVIGCAYLGVVCTGSAYGSSKAFSVNLTTNTGLVSHEIGHNWNAGHCDATPPCNIMCSGLGGCSGNLSSFEPRTASVIIGFKNSRTCLSDPAPPVLSLLTPNATTSHAPAQITATGLRLDGTSQLTVGGTNVGFTVVNATTLRFTPPSPMTIGAQAVIASNGAGASAPLNLTITGNHPSALLLTSLLLRNFPNRIDLNSDRNWIGLVLFSTSTIPSALPGLVNLGIGNAFADLFELGYVTCGLNGAGATTVTLPVSAPVGLFLHWQAITLDPSNFTVPLEVSNVRQTQIF